MTYSHCIPIYLPPIGAVQVEVPDETAVDVTAGWQLYWVKMHDFGHHLSMTDARHGNLDK